MSNGYPELGIDMPCIATRGICTLMAYEQRTTSPHGLGQGFKREMRERFEWLEKFGYSYLKDVALGADNDDEAVTRLLKLNQREWAGIALKIRAVKNRIEAENNDMHRISRN